MLLDHPPKGQGVEAIFRWADAKFAEAVREKQALRLAIANDERLIAFHAELQRLTPPVTGYGRAGFEQVAGHMASPNAELAAAIKEAIRRREAAIRREHFPADADAAGAARFSRDAA